MSFTRNVLPSTRGSLSNKRVHNPWLITATGGAPAASSASVKPAAERERRPDDAEEVAGGEHPDVTTGGATVGRHGEAAKKVVAGEIGRAGRRRGASR